MNALTPELTEEYKNKMRGFYEITLAAWEALEEKRYMNPGAYTDEQTETIRVSINQNTSVLVNFDQFIADLLSDQVSLSLMQAGMAPLIEKMEGYE